MLKTWLKDTRKSFSKEEAYEKAVEILVNAKHPLLYGWAETSIEAMRAGLKIAEAVGGICRVPPFEPTSNAALVAEALPPVKIRIRAKCVSGETGWASIWPVFHVKQLRLLFPDAKISENDLQNVLHIDAAGQPT